MIDASIPENWVFRTRRLNILLTIDNDLRIFYFRLLVSTSYTIHTKAWLSAPLLKSVSDITVGGLSTEQTWCKVVVAEKTVPKARWWLRLSLHID